MRQSRLPCIEREGTPVLRKWVVGPCGPERTKSERERPKGEKKEQPPAPGKINAAYRAVAKGPGSGPSTGKRDKHATTAALRNRDTAASECRRKKIKKGKG